MSNLNKLGLALDLENSFARPSVVLALACEKDWHLANSPKALAEALGIYQECPWVCYREREGSIWLSLGLEKDFIFPEIFI